MALSPLSLYNNYNSYNNYNPRSLSNRIGYSAGADDSGYAASASGIVRDANGRVLTDEEKAREEEKKIPGQKDGRKKPGEECQTCKRRKYQDGSDEMVSFKTPQHVSPESAAARVRAHEQEHVNNAYSKAAKGNGKVISASVAIHTAICPECGRSYVSGGTTNTQIKYYNEDNPYQKDLKAADHSKYAGMHLDYAV